MPPFVLPSKYSAMGARERLLVNARGDKFHMYLGELNVDEVQLITGSRVFKTQAPQPANSTSLFDLDYTPYGIPWQAASKEMGTQKTDASLSNLLATLQERAD